MLKKDLLLPNLFGPLWKIMMLEIFQHSRNFMLPNNIRHPRKVENNFIFAQKNWELLKNLDA
jgi:hypothetical protein